MKPITLALLILTAGGIPGSGQNSSNGIFGGYVASDRWFDLMRRSAANQAVIQRLAGRDTKGVPEGYIELAGVITFPGGNPFPKQQVPDLRIRCLDPSADDVERGPSVTLQDGSPTFYTVLKKGQTYAVSWMYFMGGKEQFATVRVNADEPRQMKMNFVYRLNGASRAMRYR